MSAITASPGHTFVKDANDALIYGMDWSDWLPDGAAIASSTWTVPTGLTGASGDTDDTITTVLISGGTLGQTYTITNRITTDESPAQTVERSFRIKIKDL